MRKAAPYLRLPFHGRTFYVEEGWYYSREERSIHRLRKHWGIDFRLARGTPILAAHDGFALAGYQHALRLWRGKPLMYQGKPVGFGMGYYVVIWTPARKRGSLSCHLERISPRLPFTKPKGRFPNLGSKLGALPPVEFVRRGRFVRAGEVIGWCGDQGCTWGYSDYPRRPNPHTHPSFDGVHLHFEVFRKYANGVRYGFVDPFGLYRTFERYPRRVTARPGALWLKPKIR